MPEIILTAILIIALILVLFLMIKLKKINHNVLNLEDIINNAGIIEKEELIKIINEVKACNLYVTRLSTEISYISIDEQFNILISKYLKYYSQNINNYSTTKEGVFLEVDLHELTIKDLNEFYPLLIEIVAVFSGKIEIIHGYNRGTSLKNFITHYKSGYIYQTNTNYHQNQGRTLVMIKHDSMIYNKYKDDIFIENDKFKSYKELAMIDLDNLKDSLLRTLKEKYSLNKRDINAVKKTN